MKTIPSPSRKRLVTLSQILSQIKDQKKITSVEISEKTGWSEATIRRDISLLELHSGKSNGYYIEELRNSIQEKLNLSSEITKHKCCIVGLGKLGESLLSNSNFEKSNFDLVAGFDSNTNRIEIMNSKIPLFSTINLKNTIESKKIHFAILCVADEKAQEVAEKLVSFGIKGIVNYTNTILSLPQEIKVENVSPIFVLGLLC